MTPRQTTSGITYNKKKGKFDIICLSETNVNWRNKEIHSNYRRIQNQVLKGGSLLTTLAHPINEGSHNPGGTAIFTTRTINSKKLHMERTI